MSNNQTSSWQLCKAEKKKLFFTLKADYSFKVLRVSNFSCVLLGSQTLSIFALHIQNRTSDKKKDNLPKEKGPCLL